MTPEQIAALIARARARNPLHEPDGSLIHKLADALEQMQAREVETDRVPMSLYEGEKHRADRCERAMRLANERIADIERELAELRAKDGG